MAFNGIIAELRNTGSDLNGAGYLPGAGTDYSQQDTAQLTLSDVSITGTTTVTSAAGGFTSAMVNNIISIGATASAANLYLITGFTNTNTITVERATGSGTGQAARVGGAMATHGMIGRLLTQGTVTSATVHHKAGTFNQTSDTANVSGGSVSLSSSITNVTWRGYTTTRGDLTGVIGGTRPTITLNGTTLNDPLTVAGANMTFENIVVDKGLSTTSSAWGFVATSASTLYRLINCKAMGTWQYGAYIQGTYAEIESFETTACTAAGTRVLSGGSSAVIINARLKGTTAGSGLVMEGPGATVVGGFFGSSAGATGHGILIANGGGTYVNVTCNGNAQSGIHFTTGNQYVTIINPLLTNNSAYGFGAALNQSQARIINAATYNNTSGAYNSSTIPSTLFVNPKTVTADPYTAVGSSDFTLNSTAGGGAVLRAAGFPSAMPGATGTNYLDIGAYQHQDSGGGGTTLIVIED